MLSAVQEKILSKQENNSSLLSFARCRHTDPLSRKGSGSLMSPDISEKGVVRIPHSLVHFRQVITN